MNTIKFSCLCFSVKNKEIMRIEKGKFIWKGIEVKDVNKIYERFSQWMGIVEENIGELKYSEIKK